MSRHQIGTADLHETFMCITCDRTVSPPESGTHHRNHCPHCLSSRHVDIRPGDRRAACRAPMAAIAVCVVNGKEWSIVHRCERCGTIKTNRIAPDDDEGSLLALAIRPLSILPFPLETIRPGRLSRPGTQ